MSDLNLGAPPQATPIKGFLLALAVLSAVGFAVFYFNPHKTAELSIDRVQFYNGHATFSASTGGVHVLGTASHTEDALYIIPNLRLTDKLRLPLFISSITATYTAPDGTAADTEAFSLTDIQRLEQSFPDLTPLVSHAISDQTQLAPGATVTGPVLLQFPNLTQADWSARKSATLTINLAHQDPQTITIP
jgi:hypothetical protein